MSGHVDGWKIQNLPLSKLFLCDGDGYGEATAAAAPIKVIRFYVKIFPSKVILCDVDLLKEATISNSSCTKTYKPQNNDSRIESHNKTMIAQDPQLGTILNILGSMTPK